MEEDCSTARFSLAFWSRGMIEIWGSIYDDHQMNFNEHFKLMRSFCQECDLGQNCAHIHLRNSSWLYKAVMHDSCWHTWIPSLLWFSRVGICLWLFRLTCMMQWESSKKLLDVFEHISFFPWWAVERSCLDLWKELRGTRSDLKAVLVCANSCFNVCFQQLF